MIFAAGGFRVDERSEVGAQMTAARSAGGCLDLIALSEAKSSLSTLRTSRLSRERRLGMGCA